MRLSSPLLTGLIILTFLSTLASLAAQTSATSAAHLDQLDETFHSTLRKYHAPLIQDYLRELDKLKQSLVARNRNQDAVVVQTEIEKIKRLSATSGLLPYDSLNAQPNKKTSEDAPDKKSDHAIFFAAGSEIRSTPDINSLQVKPDGKSVPIGAAEWKVEKIGVGSYRVAMRYSCSDISEDAGVTAKIGSTSIQRKLTSEDNTGGIKEFRFTKLGVITIDQELSKETFVLQSADPSKATIWVREIILTKVKAPENK